MIEILHFYADWCGPCKMMEPTMLEVDKEFQDKVIREKFNYDTHQEIYKEYHVMKVPTFIFKSGNQIYHKHTGTISQKELTNKIEEIESKLNFSLQEEF